MEHIITVTSPDGQVYTLKTPHGANLLETLRTAGCAPDAPCGGNGTCGKCTVLIGSEEVLACQTEVTSDLNVTLPARHDTAALVVSEEAVGVSFPLTAREGYGAAVDIGTTTVVVYLIGLSSGTILATRSAHNAQHVYGADVIARIHCSNQSGLEPLTNAIRGQLAGLLADACAEAGISPDEVVSCAVAGNTVMLHMLAGLDPSGIAVAPFTPRSLFGTTVRGSELGVFEHAEVYLTPCIAGYVGGDITAGLLSSGAYLQEGHCLFLDLGTNGEMALGGADGFVCCATAAGPAFEGAEITCGSPAVPGAVNHVSLTDSTVSFTTIGGETAKSICGSGLLDLLAVLLEAGAVDETGRLLPPDEYEGDLPGLEENDEGVLFRLNESVYLTDRDVRKLQLAKAAVAAGIRTLLDDAGLEPSDLTCIYLAGGFGSFLSVESAAAIGLIPRESVAIVRAVGNSAGKGAVDYLRSETARTDLEALPAACRYLELSSNAAFQDFYIDCMYFGEEFE